MTKEKLQDFKRRTVEQNCSFPGLRIGQMETPALEVNFLPTKAKDLSRSAASKDQQSNRGDGVRAGRSGNLEEIQDATEPTKL